MRVVCALWSGLAQWLDVLPTPLMHAGECGGEVLFNRAWGEATGDGWPDGLDPDEREAWNGVCAEVLASREPRKLQCRVQAGRVVEITVRPCAGCGGVLATCREAPPLERYRMLFEHARDVVLFVAADGRIQDANRAAEALYGYTRDELLRMHMRDLRAPETHPELEAQLRAAREHGIAFETRHRRKDGTEFPVEVSSQGQPVLMSIVRDVSERCHTEADLRLTRFALDHSGEPAFWIRADGSYIYANEAACRHLGYTLQELLRMHVWDINPEMPEAGWPAHWQELVERGTLFLESRHRRSDGSLARTEVTVALVEYEGQQINCAFVRDVTERKQREQALRKAHETVRALVEHSPLAIVAADAEGNVTSWNPAATRIFGWEEWEVLGRPNPLAAVGEEARFREFSESLARGAPVLDQEVRSVTRDGRMLDVRLSAAPIGGPERPDGMVAVLLDVTERKQLEEQLRHSQRMEAIGCLAGGMAHDFNNLLTVMNGHAFHVLDNLTSPDPRRDSILEIVHAGERAGSLIRQLLAFSRRQPLRPQVISLNTVVADLKRMLAPLIGEDVELVTRLEEKLGRVRVDPVQMEQVLMNLAVNARDAMPNGGRLTIRTTNAAIDELYASKHVGITPGRYALLAVSDTGTGMDAATKARIFDPFFTTKDPGRGTGLGLSTVYGIVQQSGGHITVSSEPGHGATFRIYLPVVDEAPVETARPAPARRSRGSETILLVEDEDAVRRFLAAVLTAQGYRVMEASQGQQALTFCDQPGTAPDMLVTDLVMPGMSGAELARRVTQLRPGIRVLYISGYSDHAALGNERLPEDRNFLQKPFSPAEFCSKVRAVLDSPDGQ